MDPNFGPQDDGYEEKTVWHVLYGKWATKVPSDHPNAIERKNKNGDIVYEASYGSFAGQLTEIRLLKTDFGWKILIGMDAGNQNNQLWLDLYSYQGRAFLNFILNTNIMQPIKLSLKKDKGDDNVERTNLFISEYLEEGDDDGRNWKGVKFKFPKWEGLPGAVEKEFQGNPVWDYTERTKVLCDHIEKEVCSLIQSGSFVIKKGERTTPAEPVKNTRTQMSEAHEDAASKSTQAPIAPEKEDDDDLPF